MGKRSTPFTCYYCGKAKDAAESSDEHIVPTSIGGTRNATLTDEVCGSCNDYMSKQVDLPFARDWFIEGLRLILGIVNKGKSPVHFKGYLQWGRPEVIRVFETEKDVWIFEVANTPDGEKRLVLVHGGADPHTVAHTRGVLRSKFNQLRVANCLGDRTGPYDEEITLAVVAQSKQGLSLKADIRTDVWHREIVKIALGLSCKVLGGAFAASEDAGRLRQFLFEEDQDKRVKLQLPGSIGIGPDGIEPRITRIWHPGGEEHLFALIGLPDKIAFVANLFGRFENLVQVSNSTSFQQYLPGDAPKGLAWIVDGAAKTTNGPLLLQDLLLDVVRAIEDKSGIEIPPGTIESGP